MGRIILVNSWHGLNPLSIDWGFFVYLYMENNLKIVRRKDCLVLTDNDMNGLGIQTYLSIEQENLKECIVTVKFKMPTKDVFDITVMED